ncbi:MAG: GrpB family protein [Gemmatimonadota bacterium]
MRDEPIHLAAYDPTWPRRFAEERALLEPVLRPWLAGPIEHVGSTAVPGLPAKPIIDIMAGVRDLPSSLAARAAVAELGYIHFPYRPDVMHWFCKPSPERRTHHLHLVPFDSRLWSDRLVFRDHLRASPADAADYAALKTELAERYRFDREAYTEAKGEFVAAILGRAAGAARGDGPARGETS